MEEEGLYLVLVTGMIPPREFEALYGCTHLLAHEHLNYTGVVEELQKNPEPEDRKVWEDKIRLENYHFIQRNPTRNMTNLVINNTEELDHELTILKTACRPLLLDPTPPHAGRSTEKLIQVRLSSIPGSNSHVLAIKTDKTSHNLRFCAEHRQEGVLQECSSECHCD
jgi:hypothetical protein